MYCEKNILSSLNNREFHITYPFNQKNFREKLLNTYFSFCDSFYRECIKSKKDLINHHINDNVLNFSKDGNYMVSANFKEILFWNLTQVPIFKPRFNLIEKNDLKNNCAVALNNNSTRIYSVKNAVFNYIASLNVYDTATSEIIRKKSCHTMKNISVFPSSSSDYVVFSSDKNELFFFDSRVSEFHKINYDSPIDYHRIISIEYHPFQEHLLLVTTSCKNAIFNIDLRNQKIIFNYNLLYNSNCSENFATYNTKGDQIFVTRNHFSPLLFSSNQSYPIFEFDEYGYCSYSKQKKGCFAGFNDEYVVSGSDNLNLYMWKIPEIKEINEEKITKKINTTKYVFRNHQSIPNVVAYNYKKSILASYGYKDEIYFWSPFSFSFVKGNDKNFFLDGLSYQRYFHFDYYTNKLSENDLKTRDFFDKDELFLTKKKKNFSVSFDYFYQNVNRFFMKTLHKDLNFCLIRSFIYNYKFTDKLKNENLKKLSLSILNEDFNQENLRYLSLIFEIRKILDTKNFIQNSIDYLLKILELFKNIKKKKNFKDENFSKINDNETIMDDLKKTIVLIRLFLLDLITIIKENKNLFEKLNQIIINRLSILHEFAHELIRINNYNQIKLSDCESEKFNFLSNSASKDLFIFYSNEYLAKLKNNDIFKRKFKKEFQNFL